MDRTVNHLASYGRHGDDTLLHVSRAELEGIRQLTGKGFTTNPHTGLPEAFSWSNAATAGRRLLNRPDSNMYVVPNPDVAKTSSGQIAGTAMPGEPGMFVGGGAAPNATSATDADFANQLGSTGPANAPNGMPLPPVPPDNPDASQLERNKFYKKEPGPVNAIDPIKKFQSNQGPPGLIGRLSNLGTRLGKIASGVGDSASQFLNGLSSTPDASAMPDVSSIPDVSIAFAKGGLASLRAEEGMTANIVNEAKAALLNEHPRPKEALARFEGMFGSDALSMLRDKMVGGRITGAGGGMDDLIPGTIEGRQRVRLADGEFVVPADVVSGLGDGSTDHGVRRLHEMMNSVRKQRTGKEAQPKSIGGKITL